MRSEAEQTFVAPATLEEALDALSSNRLRVVAGGTDLVVAARSGKTPLPAGLLAIHQLRELETITRSDQGLHVGALVPHAMLEASDEVRAHYTALSDACALVGSPATRSFGTLGGNLCNASPAAETSSPLIVLDAVAELRSSEGSREVQIRDFCVGPGRTVLREDELLTEVRIPQTPARAGSAYVRLEYRRAMEIAVVGAAAFVALTEDGTVERASVSLTAVGPRPLPVDEINGQLAGAKPGPQSLAAAAELAAAVAQPIDDVRGSGEYRSAMVPVITRRALEAAVRRAEAG